jgi:hypothetical protein
MGGPSSFPRLPDTISVIGSTILTDADAASAGSITMAAEKAITLIDTEISSQVAGTPFEPVPADITLAAPNMTLTRSTISASTLGIAEAGSINLAVGHLTMSSDSIITSNALPASTGRGGTIRLGTELDSSLATLIPFRFLPVINERIAPGITGMTVNGGTILAESATSSAAGAIAINSTGDLQLVDSTVSVQNTATGNAGPMNVRAGNNLTVRNAVISTESEAASGGNIKLTAPNLIRIVDSTITSSVKGQAGSNGGNIDIDPQLVVIQNSNITANANAGAGGNINIAALGAVLVDPNSLLSATAGPAGVSGSVNISSPIQVLSGALVPMKLAYTQTGLSNDRCVADPKGRFSSFVQTGRDGAPQTPGGLASSPLGFLDTYQTSSLHTDGTITQAARLGLSELFGPTTNAGRFFSGCQS